MQIPEITKQHRNAQGLSLRKFADAINEKLINTDVSFSTVNRWEDEANPYEPDMQLLFECIATYRDWRAKWAIDCINAMYPDLTGSGIIKFRLPIAG